MTLEYSVENAVHEPPGLLGAKLFCKLDGFVQNDEFGNVGLEEELIHGEPQDVAIDWRHPLQPPVLGLLAYQLVDMLQMLQRTSYESLGILQGAVELCLITNRRVDSGYRSQRFRRSLIAFLTQVVTRLEVRQNPVTGLLPMSL